MRAARWSRLGKAGQGVVRAEMVQLAVCAPERVGQATRVKTGESERSDQHSQRTR